MHFLIDADSLIYKAGCSNEKRMYHIYDGANVIAEFQYKKEAKEFVDGDETLTIEFHKEAGPLSHSLSNIDNMLVRIVEHRRCSSYDVYIGGGKNFRYDIDPEYKGHRDESTRPIHEKQLRKHLESHWGAEVITGIEVDDHVSILCMQDQDNNVIVTIDKDLDNTPGWHYNYDKQKATFISDEEADLNFYRQLLSGDPTDNIKGVKGIGKQRAEDILPHALTPERMCSIVWKVYQEKDYTLEYMIQQGQLLWMLREEDVMWMPPVDVHLLSTQLMVEEESC